MKRYSLLMWIVIFGASAVGLFHIKHNVQNLKRDIIEVNRQLDADNDAIHVLRAEWSYLNQPERLRTLAARHLDLAPIEVAQIKSLDYQMIMAGSNGAETHPAFAAATLSEVRGFRDQAMLASLASEEKDPISVQAYPIRKPRSIPQKVTR